MNETFTKEDLVKLVSRRTGVKRKTTKLFIDAVLFSIADLLSEMGDGDRLEIRGFGVFKKYYHFPQGKFHNPRTMKNVKAPGRMKIKWYPSALIKNKILK